MTWFGENWIGGSTTADVCLITPGPWLVIISKTLGVLCLSMVYLFFSHSTHRLITGESNLSSWIDEERLVASFTWSPAVILTGDLGLTCKQCEDKKIFCGVRYPCLHVTSSLSHYYKVIIFSTVLKNFSRKSRNTVSVREGQAVVLLCGPPPHYGGTVLCPKSSALSAVLSLSCFPQQSVLLHTLLLIIALMHPFCF